MARFFEFAIIAIEIGAGFCVVLAAILLFDWVVERVQRRGDRRPK